MNVSSLCWGLFSVAEGLLEIYRTAFLWKKKEGLLSVENPLTSIHRISKNRLSFRRSDFGGKAFYLWKTYVLKDFFWNLYKRSSICLIFKNGLTVCKDTSIHKSLLEIVSPCRTPSQGLIRTFIYAREDKF